MKERPILFSGDMVQAILDGRKTQTRRVIKPQPEIITTHDYSIKLLQIKGKGPWFEGDPNRTCPYGVVGDRLWVREMWCTEHRLDDIKPSKIGEAATVPIWYRATDDLNSVSLIPGKWRPSIFMPRWASRILLEITDVRVERLQKISEADAVAEGAGYWGCDTVEVFRDLWDSINAKRGYSWSSNPWCWCISFKKIGK
jgi:hypothetical protein